MKKYKRIRELRKEKGMTQEEMAKELKIMQRTYSRYENSDSMIPLDILIEIADFHNVSVDYLLERTDTRRRRPKK
ncbi:MAG: helix-turn-helix transcriptional regulator [Eubacteriales bacterium]|nr:helix-turn-helix transcriptional regulator [Eubacteriales bacterium]